MEHVRAKGPQYVEDGLTKAPILNSETRISTTEPNYCRSVSDTASEFALGPVKAAKISSFAQRFCPSNEKESRPHITLEAAPRDKSSSKIFPLVELSCDLSTKDPSTEGNHGRRVSRAELYTAFEAGSPLADYGKLRLSENVVSTWEIALLTSLNLPYGFICGTFGLWILPAEALRLCPESQSLVLGVYLGLVGLSQLVCPVAGKISDRHPAPSLFNRRKPYLVGGATGATVATVGMFLSSKFFWTISYPICLFLGMLSLNLTYSVDCGLVPDVLDSKLEGRASGLVAVHTLTGSAIGFLLIRFSTALPSHHFVYFIQIVSCNLAILLTCIIARQLEHRLRAFAPLPLQTVLPHQQTTPEGAHWYSNADSTEDNTSSLEEIELPQNRKLSDDGYIVCPKNSFDAIDSAIRAGPDTSTARKETTAELQLADEGNDFKARAIRCVTCRWLADMARPLNEMQWSDYVAAYKIDLTTSLDFFWVFVGRSLYYVGVSVQAFMLYYLRDVGGEPSEEKRRIQLGSLALTGQAIAASVAFPIGKQISTGRSMKRLIHVSCAIMCVSYLGFMLAPLFLPKEQVFSAVLWTSVLYGAGNGCFFAVDYALALATLPPGGNSAQSLGIWGVSGFIGSALGPLLFGTFLALCGRSPEHPEQYRFSGYVFLLGGGIVATAAAGAVIQLIKSVK